ncbi:unnamed protein product [Notodromas monacha]|uniref:G-protein coupled receptors family 2 profile 2 domain-containing protein n=1 Tax=Notodromas monacha TaxID=399045 RepID=A0A7R9BIY2_9CRUS|nr:unnamed protein product [Notodromas monacha]CAG0915477.1 unnamed protein product [Notodromas monacha]
MIGIVGKSFRGIAVKLPWFSTSSNSRKMLIDLRSDTVTRPSQVMRQRIAEAEVGDDVFGDDPTIKKLEGRVAEILGMEAGLYVPSGTMGNLLAVMTHCCSRGAEVILGDKSHIYLYEQGGYAQLGGVSCKAMKTLPNGTFSLEEFEANISEDDLHCATTKLVCIENTCNYVGGRALPLDWIDALVASAEKRKVPVHVDGARLFNAAVSSGVPASRLLRGCASCNICLSKGLGAPIGSVLVGGADFIARARRTRKAVGGAMRQVGILGAAGLVALDNVQRLHEDHENAKIFANGLVQLKCKKIEIDPSLLDSNIGLFKLNGITPTDFCRRLEEVTEEESDVLGEEIKVLMGPWDVDTVRFCNVFEYDNIEEIVDCYTCDGIQPRREMCCLGGKLATFHLYAPEYFLPACVTEYENGTITARRATELPLFKAELMNSCEDGESLCYCDSPGCNNDANCDSFITSSTSTTEAIPTTEDIVTTQDPPTEPPAGLQCPKRNDVVLAAKKYNLKPTEPGQVFSTRCKTRFPNGEHTGSDDGFSDWQCLESSVWDLETPNFSDCWDVNYTMHENNLWSMNGSVAEMVQVLRHLTTDLDEQQNTTVGGDVIRAASFAGSALKLWTSLPGTNITFRDEESFLREYVRIFDQMGDMTVGWRTCGGNAANVELLRGIIGDIFTAAFSMNDDVFWNEDSHELQFSFIKLVTSALPKGSSIGASQSKPFKYRDSSLIVQLTNDDASNVDIRLTVVGVQKLHQFIQPMIRKPTRDDGDNATSWSAVSIAMGAQVDPGRSLVSENSTISVRLRTICTSLPSDTSARCFGMENSEDSGQWTDEFCEVEDVDSAFLTCKCKINKVLMVMAAVPGRPEDHCIITSDVLKDLDAVVIPGYAVAGTLCILTCFVVLFKHPAIFKCCKLTRTNFLFCYGLLMFAMLLGTKVGDKDSVACSVTGGVAFYLLLASVSWLLMESMCVSLLLIPAMEFCEGMLNISSGRRMLSISLLCYGLPAVWIGITAVATKVDEFKTPEYCFLDLHTASVWSLIVHHTLAYLIMMIVGLVTMIRKRRAKQWECAVAANSRATTVDPINFLNRAAFQSMFLALFTLVSWMCACYYLSKGSKAAAVAFTVFNCAEGILLAVFCLLEFRKTRSSPTLEQMVNEMRNDPSGLDGSGETLRASQDGTAACSNHMMNNAHMIPRAQVQSLRQRNTNSAIPFDGESQSQLNDRNYYIPDSPIDEHVIMERRL